MDDTLLGPQAAVTGEGESLAVLRGRLLLLPQAGRSGGLTAGRWRGTGVRGGGKFPRSTVVWRCVACRWRSRYGPYHEQHRAAGSS